MTIRTCCRWTARSTASTTSRANRRTRPVRRQLELARAGLVSGELPADRIAAEVSPLLGRRLQGGVSDRIGQDDDLWEVAAEISRRLSRIFLRDDDGRRPVHGGTSSSRTTRTGATSCCSTSTSTATTAQAWARATRRGGRPWWRSCCSRAGSEDDGTEDLLGYVHDPRSDRHLVLPLWWALGATIPICCFSWWVAYRSDWF